VTIGPVRVMEVGVVANQFVSKVKYVTMYIKCFDYTAVCQQAV